MFEAICITVTTMTSTVQLPMTSGNHLSVKVTVALHHICFKQVSDFLTSCSLLQGVHNRAVMLVFVNYQVSYLH